MRVWGFEKMARVSYFAFDFVNKEGEHIKTPAGLTITLVNYSPGAPVYSYQESMARSFSSFGSLGQTLANAPEEDIGLETYMIPEGALLKINYQNTDIQVQIPVHDISPYIPGIPVATFSSQLPSI